jgi:hypothetical protein
MAAIPVAEAIQAAEGDSKCFWLRGWGMHASEGDLQTVLQRLWAAREPGIIANLLKVFSARALPEFDARLIELCYHGDEEVRRRANAALSQNAHSLVREFALSELQKGVRHGSVVALFINNYTQGDEQRILEAMERPDDECELHWLLMDAIKVLEKNPEADCSRLGIIAYAMTPCENCRFYAVCKSASLACIPSHGAKSTCCQPQPLQWPPQLELPPSSHYGNCAAVARCSFACSPASCPENV